MQTKQQLYIHQEALRASEPCLNAGFQYQVGRADHHLRALYPLAPTVHAVGVVIGAHPLTVEPE